MRLALTGAHGTGKTTTARRLAEKMSLQEPVFVSGEPARRIIEKVGDISFFHRGNNTPLRQALIFIEHMIDERAQLTGATHYITERTFVDHLAYTAYLFPALLGTPEYAVLRDISFESLSTHDVIFRHPIEFPLQEDGIREPDVVFQQEIDTTISLLFEESGVTPVTVYGTVDQRVTFILQYLGLTAARTAGGEP